MQRRQPITAQLRDNWPESVMSTDQRKFRTVHQFGRKKRHNKRKHADCAGDQRNSNDAVEPRNGPAEAAANGETCNAAGSHGDSGRSNGIPIDSGAGAAEDCTTSRKKLDLFGGMYLLQKNISMDLFHW